MADFIPNLFGQLSELGQVTPCQEGPRPRQLRLADDVILDYFFRVNIGISWVHGFSHSNTAMENAKAHFGIGVHTQNVIESHMWPLNITKIPRCREAWVVCLADKYVSTKETLLCR